MSAADWISTAATCTSIWPVGSLALTVSGLRLTTLPVTVTTLSERSRSKRLEDRAFDVGDALGHAVMVAQVDEQQIAMVALAVHPARKRAVLPASAIAQLAAGVGPGSGVHLS